MGRAIAVLAGVLHVDRDARKIFDHDFARQACVPARSAGGNDQLFEGQQRAFDGIQFAGENDVVLQVLCDRLRDGRGLLVDLPPHGVGMRLVCAGSSVLFGRSHRNWAESKSFLVAPGKRPVQRRVPHVSRSSRDVRDALPQPDNRRQKRLRFTRRPRSGLQFLPASFPWSPARTTSR